MKKIIVVFAITSSLAIMAKTSQASLQLEHLHQQFTQLSPASQAHVATYLETHKKDLYLKTEQNTAERRFKESSWFRNPVTTFYNNRARWKLNWDAKKHATSAATKNALQLAEKGTTSERNFIENLRKHEAEIISTANQINKLAVVHKSLDDLSILCGTQALAATVDQSCMTFPQYHSMIMPCFTKR
jgi:hypothetical protein